MNDRRMLEIRGNGLTYERACADDADALAELLAFVNGRRTASSLGTLPSGSALNQEYTEPTSEGLGSLTAILQGHNDIAATLAETFRRMGDQYVETDEAVAAALHPSDKGGR